MLQFVHQKGSIHAANLVMLFLLSASNGTDLRFLTQESVDHRSGNRDQYELQKSILGQSELRRILGHSEIYDSFLGQSEPKIKKTLNMNLNQLGRGLPERSKPTQALKSDFRSKRAVFDILPEGSQRAAGGRRISFERSDGQLVDFSRRKEQQERVKSMLKKYLKTVLNNNNKQKTRRFSSLRVCRFTFMKICQRIAQIGK